MYSETTREALGAIASVFSNIMTYALVIMIAVLMVALAFFYITDASKYIKEKDKAIKKLQDLLQEAERSKSDGYRKNLETSGVADKIFGMYLDEKDRAETNELRFVEWDKKQVKRITALENQLRENGIEPIKWEEIKVA